ncbi:MAG: CvpA family protein [Planctomycetota bacterium]|nr:MAG: CvpA family protein [Planctomycetota bacterium]REK26699.1 MAG: CvpA family protein [Planctomycetota bacterium]REK35640.1 MAG: CvpA family protein [Planctomycetota bacterium]
MIDFALLAILIIVTFFVANEGAWGAGLTFLSVLFAGLLAMNWFEPLANTLQGMYADGAAPVYWDIIALVGLFAGLVFGFRALTDHLMPTYVSVDGFTYNIGRWILGLATGYVVMAFCLTALHTAPLPREFAGFRPERQNLFDIAAPDRQWLALTQYVSETSLSRPGRTFDAVTLPRIEGKPEMMTLSSFPIRYATRREMFMAGSASSSSAAPPPGGGGAPPPTPSAPTGSTPSF